MTAETIVKDKDLGDVLFRLSARARRYSIKVKHRNVTVVIPIGGNFNTAKRFLESNRAHLIKVREAQTERIDNIEDIQKVRERDYELLAQARVYLPVRLKELADLHGFHYNRLTLRNSKTRWGSCSSKKNINLSIYLMNLPERLIDYVILHELSHLTHMNHSPAFWELLDKLTDNQAKTLRKELKEYRCS